MGIAPKDRWVDIPGYAYRYQVNELGQVSNLLPNGKRRFLHAFPVRCERYGDYGQTKVQLVVTPGHPKNVPLSTIMADAFMGGRENHKGLVVMHRNGSTSDFAIENLYWGSYHKLGKRYGGGGRTPIEKIDRRGNVVEIFRSQSECAEKEHISRKALWGRLYGKVRPKYEYDLTGYTYRLEERAGRRRKVDKELLQ